MVKMERLLAVSYAYPPMAYPRALQVSRLLRGLGASTVVVCAEAPTEPQDHTIGLSSFHPQCVLREPFSRGLFQERLDNLAARLGVPRLPDIQRSWVTRAFQRYVKWQSRNEFRPDVLMTFGMPMSDHFFGIAHKKRWPTPWIAHFSDPWADSAYHRRGTFAKWLTRRMERAVIEAADAVLFTSPETIELVMRKYPEALRKKVHCLPHICDRSIYDPSHAPPTDNYVIRFVGHFYGPRSPRPTLEGLTLLAAREPHLFRGIVLEFVGSKPRNAEELANLFRDCPLLQEKTRFTGPVSFSESIRRMQTAHCLLVIDAPVPFSVYFPSKLVDYIGTGRFVAAISPPGATSRIVREVGGCVADPSDGNAVAEMLKTILEKRPQKLPVVTNRYDEDVVCAEMLQLVRRIHSNAHN